MCKLYVLNMLRYTARLTKLNEYIPLFPGPDDSKNIEEEEMNKILLHSVPNPWANQYYLWRFTFESGI